MAQKAGDDLFCSPTQAGLALAIYPTEMPSQNL